MKIETREEILEILKMPEDEFRRTVMPAAKQAHIAENGNRLIGTAMLGFSNICRNRCLYCGMRAPNTAVPRYRIPPQDALASVKSAYGLGFRRIFFVSGEDPKYTFDMLLELVSGAKKAGMTHVSLAVGEYEKEQYRELHDAGVDEYVMKFEFSDRDTFARMKPTSVFEHRLGAAEWIRGAGMELASGNIVDWPGQTLQQLTNDILLMKKLEIHWAPVIPYLPAKNTPLAAEGGRGSLLLNLKEISILRLMMPKVELTAQQPGADLTEGLASVSGNLDALAAGADMLFADLLPAAQAQAFRVVDNRITLGLDHIEEMARRSGMKLTLE